MRRAITVLSWSMVLWPILALAEAPTVLFILDASGSMWAQVQGKPRIEIARAVMTEAVQSLPDDVRIGLIAYGHNRKDDCKDIEVVNPIESKREEIAATIAKLMPKGQTPLADSLKFAVERLKEREGATSVVLVSDGAESCGGDPCEAARAAAASGVNLRVYVVGFDVGKEEAEQLRCIATEGKGKYFSASNAGELTSALAEVRQEVMARVQKIKLGGKGTLEFRWPGDDDFWDVYRGETKVSSGVLMGTRKIALQAGTYTVKPSNYQPFEPFEVTIRDGEVTTVQKGGFLEFRWPGDDDFWDVYRGETKAVSPNMGTQKIALQAGTYTVKPSFGQPFEPFQVTIADGETVVVEP